MQVDENGRGTAVAGLARRSFPRQLGLRQLSFPCESQTVKTWLRYSQTVRFLLDNSQWHQWTAEHILPFRHALAQQ